MGFIGRMAGRFGRKPAPVGFDAVTRALLEPGRTAFRELFADNAPRVSVAVNDPGALDVALAAFIADAAAGDALTIEIPNTRVAELDGLAIGMTVAELEASLRTHGLDIADAYGIGYVPKSLTKDKPFFKELAANPGVYATPTDCVLLAYRARVPIDLNT